MSGYSGDGFFVNVKNGKEALRMSVSDLARRFFGEPAGDARSAAQTT
jgi:hypothetical protein